MAILWDEPDPNFFLPPILRGLYFRRFPSWILGFVHLPCRFLHYVHVHFQYSFGSKIISTIDLPIAEFFSIRFPAFKSADMGDATILQNDQSDWIVEGMKNC